MLSVAPIKNRRRRRRRHKRSVPVTQANDSRTSELGGGGDGDDDSMDDKINDQDTDRQQFSPKVNSQFINEDVEIETAMLLKHLTKDTEFTLKKQRAIEFFTSNVPIELKSLSKQRSDSVTTIKNPDEQIEIMPSPTDEQTDETENFPADGPQLAADYLNDDLNFDSVVVPFQKQAYECINQQMFYSPALALPKQFPQDVESATATTTTPSNATAAGTGTGTSQSIVLRNVADEGYFIRPKPKISRVNLALFLNRLIEEGDFRWYDFQTHEIKDLINLTIGRRLIKSFCEEKFHPIDYTPTSVFHELDTFSFQDRILKIHIKYIYFDIHPSFNDEQRLARELESLHDEYVTQKQNDILGKIETKLKILRQLLETVSKSAAGTASNTSGSVSGKGNRMQKKQTNLAHTVDTLQVHRDELKELRATWHRESARHRELMKTILEKWSTLKKLRDGIDKPDTTLKLVIKAHDTDREEDEYEWARRFELEHREMWIEAMDVYRKQKATRKKLAKAGIQTEDEENLLNADIVKPNSSAIEQELSDIYAASVRPPGEQIIDFELEKSHTAPIKSPPKYVVRLLFEDGQLEFPESLKLNGVGQAQINAIYSIKFTTKIPHKLRFQICEKTNLPVAKRVAEGYYQTPNETEVFVPSEMAYVEFESHTVKKYMGKIVCALGWSASDSQSEQLSARYGNEMQTKGINNTPQQGTVSQWYSDQLIDPMDPENTALATAMDKSLGQTATMVGAASASAQTATVSTITTSNRTNDDPTRRKLFRLNEDSYAFCDRDKLMDNKRIELLNARFNSDLKLKDCKLVPHNEIEIEIPVDLQIFEDMLWVDPIDVQRYQGKKYLKHVYDIITNHCEVINRNYEHRNLLLGDTPPTLYGALEAFTNIFSPRRPLNPHRKTLIRKANFLEDRVNRFNIIINVVRASGIPYRNVNEVTVNRRTSLGSTMQNLHRHANVRPFVTATFRDKTLRTSTVDGSSPTWNEQIVIPINESINQIKDSLWFHMYDEIIEDIHTSNDNIMTPTSEIYQKISSHYLGELLIPFSTIYASQRIEGTFEMSTPLILLGYTKPTVNVPDHGVAGGGGGIDTNGGLIETRQSILVSLLISIEPIIEITQFPTSHLECVELRAIKNRIAIWLSEITDEFPARAQDPLVSLANGKRVCITRLICPIDIPFERNETSEYMIRRFVSLIPVRPHKNVCTKLNGVWLTNDQILNILIVSPKDLGVLLTCFYLSLGFNAYLVLGFAVPYGDTTFVLTKEHGQFYLIDPHTGRKCSSRDTFCALMKVYCIVNARNVWANIQREERVFMQNFDTTQTLEWRELFTKSTPAPADTVHDLTLTYTDSLDCENLQRSIEMKIMKKFRCWRSDRKTVWNKRYSDVMQEILKELEQDECFGLEQKSYVTKLMESTQSKYKLSGYPINMPYVSIAKIIERIKATEIHLNSDPKVEFSLGVHIQSYPMNIFSVWIFILALIPIA